MPGRADALRDMATVTTIVGQVPGQRPPAFWVEVARIVCERHGVSTLRGDADLDDPDDRDITRRQAEVLTGLADGLTYRAIGTRLGIAESTVKVTAHNTFTRIGAASSAHAVAIALRAGWIT